MKFKKPEGYADDNWGFYLEPCKDYKRVPAKIKERKQYGKIKLLPDIT